VTINRFSIIYLNARKKQGFKAFFCGTNKRINSIFDGFLNIATKSTLTVFRRIWLVLRPAIYVTSNRFFVFYLNTRKKTRLKQKMIFQLSILLLRLLQKYLVLNIKIYLIFLYRQKKPVNLLHHSAVASQITMYPIRYALQLCSYNMFSICTNV
jgi:hypothetical protein